MLFSSEQHSICFYILLIPIALLFIPDDVYSVVKKIYAAPVWEIATDYHERGFHNKV